MAWLLVALALLLFLLNHPAAGTALAVGGLIYASCGVER